MTASSSTRQPAWWPSAWCERDSGASISEIARSCGVDRSTVRGALSHRPPVTDFALMPVVSFRQHSVVRAREWAASQQVAA